MMDSFCIFLILGLTTTILINNSNGIYHQRRIRALDFPTQWRPLAVPAGNEHLISIANFDSTNNAQLAQIAHHNAQILRQIKGLHPPVTQYHNPFPIFSSGHGGKNVFVHTNIIHPDSNLLTSSSNVAQTIVPHSIKHNNASPKPSFLGKSEMNSPFKYANSFHTSTVKIPGLMKTVSVQPSYPIYASTTNRVPIISRDATLTPPPAYRSTQKPHPVVNKFNAHLASSSRTKSPVMAASNFDAFSIPGQILSSFTHFAQPAHMFRDNKPRVSNNFLNYQIEQPLSNSLSGHLIPSGHFISKNHFQNAMRYPQNSISSVFSPHLQQTVHSKHPTSHFQPGLQQIAQNHHLSPQQPQYEKPKEQQHLTETFHSQQNSNHETENQFQKPPVESVDNSNSDGSYLPPLPSVPPSVLSPFFQQIQQQQQHQRQQSPTTTESSEQTKDQHHYPNAFDLYNNHHDIQFSNFKAVDDEFTLNLVPPPFKHRDTSQFREKSPSSSVSSHIDIEQIKAIDILNKYNIPAISPLQDTNRFSYNSRPLSSTETPDIFQPSEKQSGTSTSFTTEKPNIFQNLNRPTESEYKQHKLMHPGYTGSKRPVQSHSTNQPFLPTPHSHDVAITHSFFTIEDAITLSPKHSYRPISPTNTDQIEEIIRKPEEEEITEVITSFTNGNNDIQESGKETTSQPMIDTSTRLRGRGNKIRRRRPKPTTEANNDSDSQGQWETIKTDSKKTNEDSPHRYPNYKEAAFDEDSKVVEGFGNFNRNRHRRPSSTTSTLENDVNEKPSRARRPLNKTRQRMPSQSTPTGADNEHTTTEFNQNLLLSSNNIKSRRPTTTLQTFSSPSTHYNIYKDVETMNPVTVNENFEIQTNSPMRTRIYTTAHHVDATEPLSINSIEAHPEENAVVISTKAGFNEIMITDAPELHTTVNERPNTFPVDDVVFTTQHVSTTTASTTSKKSEESNEKPVFDQTRHRQRLRYKEKLKDAFSSTTTATTTTDQAVKTIQDNEVTDNRVNVRLPIVTSSTNGDKDEETGTTPTLSTNKLNRLNSINKFDLRHRPRFSVKDYRQRLSTSTTTEQQSSVSESTTLASTKLRFPTRTRLLPDLRTKSAEKTPKAPESTKSSEESSDLSNTSESLQENVDYSNESSRKRFSPKDRYSSRVKSTENPTTTNRPTTRNRGSSTRRDFGNRGRQSTTTPLPVEKTVSRAPTIRNATYPLRRPQNVSLRQRIQNHYRTTKEPTTNEEVDSKPDMTIENKSDEISTEDYKQETAIMKIAKDDHSYRPYKASDEMNYNDSENDLNGSPSEQSERVAELAIFDNSFSAVNTGSASRRIPGYFTIATEDPILPIEAFFPQVKRD